jgi:beta-1,4-mannosyl-glycoprotein beta-1,4-N-acetylglucosaminyltransferase
MADWVDTFVIYEARHSYTGLPKPLHFAEGRERVAPFAHKILHFVIDDAPPYAREAWARELCQRASIMTRLSDLIGPDDLVMLSDTDEVLERAVVESFDGLYANCGLRTFCWFLNYRLLNPVKQGAKSCLIKGRFLHGFGAARVRLGLGSLVKDILPEAGWHFTSVLSPEALKIKLDSYSHEDWAGSSVAKQEAFLSGIREGREYAGYVRQPLDSSFPRYIRDQRQALAQFIL